ncbi:AraC family transcriptional regulator [Mameliella sediminis]|uniref:AraC family transcriptional regulator n=1 Tax=Mameliella sediminis TaxID=2836866 RepID=UPI001C455305|nr:AraC family transcriptional regulator N-terminal domain-containing protein [Mameliella sediminis]MBV7395896.1 AraC family transcriptional regulator N-terminal domain-containing protein [Mameliella sediminis]
MNDELRTRLTALRDAQDRKARIGFVETGVPSVRLFWADAPVARAPLSYAPGIAIIVSGRKIGFFGDRRIEYGPGQYLAVGLPLYFECETVASPEEPLIGIFLSADPEDLRSLAAELSEHDLPTLPPQSGLGIEPLAMPGSMGEALARLARQLCSPAEAAVLSPGTLREIFFHALLDRHGRALLSQLHGNRPEARIARVLRDLDGTGEAFAGVSDLARATGMSAASFHRHFKAVTGLPPLQYLKRKRLMQAKSLLVHNGMGVAETAHAVGYASPAQFSRDFSAFFGLPPSLAAETAYPA